MIPNPDLNKKKKPWSKLDYVQAVIAFFLCLSLLLNFGYCEIYNNGFSDLLLTAKAENDKYYLFLGGHYRQTSPETFFLLRKWSWVIIALFSSLFILCLIGMMMNDEEEISE